MSKNDEDSNVSSLPAPKRNQNFNRVYFGIFDARDSSLLPLQIILLVLASLETYDGFKNVIFPGDDLYPHVYAHLGSYTLAYAIALFAIAFRPARARGLLIIVSVAAFGFIATSVVDVLSDRTEIAGEIEHITKLLAPFIVWIIASRVVTFSKSDRKSKN